AERAWRRGAGACGRSACAPSRGRAGAEARCRHLASGRTLLSLSDTQDAAGGGLMRLSIRNLHASLGGARVLRGVSLDIDGPNFVGLVGPNGAGKTTLVRAVAGLIPFDGAILIDGAPVKALRP